MTVNYVTDFRQNRAEIGQHITLVQLLAWG
jgi:hypothetical protein